MLSVSREQRLSRLISRLSLLACTGLWLDLNVKPHRSPLEQNLNILLSFCPVTVPSVFYTSSALNCSKYHDDRVRRSHKAQCLLQIHVKGCPFIFYHTLESSGALFFY